MTETPYPPPGARPVGLRWPLARSGPVTAAMAMIGGGMAMSWGWLTAIGAAPLILNLAPCAAMCVTGFCVMCRSNGSGTEEPEACNHVCFSARKEVP